MALKCLTILFITLHAAHITGAVPSLRGVTPEAAAVYKTAITAGSFKCLNGSPTIPAAAINDNYCDCSDGSDEPGSSACSSGSFYCRNRGHKARKLSSTFVDDGICDCCDGTDEPDGLCNDTCVAEGAAAQQELLAAAKTAAAGNKVRAQRVKAAKKERHSIHSKLQSLKAQIATARPEVDKLAAKKEATEKVAKSLREQQGAAEAAEKKTRLARENAQAPSQEPDADSAADSESAIPSSSQEAEGRDTDGAVEGPLAANGGADSGGSSADTPEVASSSTQPETVAQPETEAKQDAVVKSKPEAAAQTDEERAKKTMAQWVKDDVRSAAEEEAKPDVEGDDEDDHEADPDAVDDEEDLAPEASTDDVGKDEESSGDDGSDGEHKGDTVFQRAVQWVSALLKKTPQFVAPSELKRCETEATEASRKHQQRNDELQDFVRKQQELETKAALEYGPDDAFLPLHGKCYKTEVDKYVYEACPFGSASQKEGGSSTSLGSFSRFENNFTSMVFDNGQSCWQGPNRSLTLALTCGSAEVLSAVSEPSRCVYAAKLTTPVLCTSEFLQKLQAEVKAAQTGLNYAKHHEL